MQRTLDNFFHKVSSVEETIPRAWRETPLPKSPLGKTPKRPVGRPKKMPSEEAREEVSFKISPISEKYTFFNIKR